MVFLPIYTFIQNRLHIAKHDLYYIPILYGSTLLPFPLHLFRTSCVWFRFYGYGYKVLSIRNINYP